MANMKEKDVGLKSFGIGFLFFICCVVFTQHVNASTSCAGAQVILGFSKDWKQLYWDQEIAGECSSGNLLHVFDFEKNEDRVIASFYDDDSASEKKKYDAIRKKIKQAVHLSHKNTNRNITKDACRFDNGLELPRDPYLGGVEAIQAIYFNPIFRRWVVMAEACNMGNSADTEARCAYQVIYILPEKSCKLSQ